VLVIYIWQEGRFSLSCS